MIVGDNKGISVGGNDGIGYRARWAMMALPLQDDDGEEKEDNEIWEMLEGHFE